MVLVGSQAEGGAAAHAGTGFESSDDEENVEYDTSPFTIDWLDLSHLGCTAPLGISGLPGCRFKDTWRKLENDISCIRDNEVKDVFVLLMRGELHKYRVPWLLNELSAADMTVHHYPFPDGATPAMATLYKMLDEITICLKQGRKSLIHCFGGLGRSGLVAVCLLMILDQEIEPDAAIQTLRDLRGPGAVQSVKQYNFVHEFREKYKEYEQTLAEKSRSVSR